MNKIGMAPAEECYVPPILNLGPKRDYGEGAYYEGIVIVPPAGSGEVREIEVLYWEPPKPDRSKHGDILLPGWLAGPETMDTAARVATRAGHLVLSPRYTNTSPFHALEANAADAAAVADSIEASLLRNLVGHSMSGAVATMAVEKTHIPVKTVTNLTPAMHILADLDMWIIGTHFAATIPELADLVVKKPLLAWRLGMSCVRNCARRPLGIPGEFIQLTTGTIHDTMNRITDNPDVEAPFFHLVLGEEDSLLPKKEQLAGASPLKFNKVSVHDGGHLSPAHDPSVMELTLEGIREAQQKNKYKRNSARQLALVA
jgi:pimeloyl-ACP methyl ester carboxylesterase